MSTKPVVVSLSEIEEAQAGLRDSIEQAKDLTEEMERLVLQSRAEAATSDEPAR